MAGSWRGGPQLCGWVARHKGSRRSRERPGFRSKGGKAPRMTSEQENNESPFLF